MPESGSGRDEKNLQVELGRPPLFRGGEPGSWA